MPSFLKKEVNLSEIQIKALAKFYHSEEFQLIKDVAEQIIQARAFTVIAYEPTEEAVKVANGEYLFWKEFEEICERASNSGNEEIA